MSTTTINEGVELQKKINTLILQAERMSHLSTRQQIIDLSLEFEETKKKVETYLQNNQNEFLASFIQTECFGFSNKCSQILYTCHLPQSHWEECVAADLISLNKEI
jgi:hypothetical protein